MIGLVIITHAQLGRELINAAEFIVGRIEKIEAVSVDGSASSDQLHTRLEQAIAKVQGGEGVLVLTDMFGGTPNNISLTLLDIGRVDIITGVNLPMVIKAATERAGKNLEELGKQVRASGQDSISLAGELLDT